MSIAGPVGKIVGLLAGSVSACAPQWLASWMAAETAAQSAISVHTDAHFVEPTLARRVADTCVAGSNLVVSSSMPIRDVEWFGTVTPGVTVHSNRGANGIDGVVSTAVGIALATERPTVLYIGDVAMVHDSNGLWGLAARGIDLTIVVSNNDGGSIFSFLPQRTQLSTERFEQLFGTPHGTDLVALARAHGLGARTVSTRDELLQAVADREATVVRVESNRSANVAVHDALHAAVAAALKGE